jgi:hypothetical protein
MTQEDWNSQLTSDGTTTKRVCPDLVPQQRMEEDPHRQTPQRESYSFPFCKETKNSRDSIPKVHKIKTLIPKALAFDKLSLNSQFCINMSLMHPTSSRVALVHESIG